MRRWMTRPVVLGVLVAAVLVLPAAARANTGSVTCDARGVVFTYNDNFTVSKTATETVGDVSRTFQVPENMSAVDIWPGLTGSVTAGAEWNGGSIPTQTLTCPAPPAPPVAPPAPPAPPAAPPAVPVAPPAAPPVVVVPPTKPPKCPEGTVRQSYDSKAGVLVCLRILHDHPAKATRHKKKKKERHVRGAVSIGGKKTPKVKAGGVTG